MVKGIRRLRFAGPLVRLVVAAAVVAALVGAPSSAVAASSSQQGYNPSGPRVQQQVQDRHRGLPFTGLDLVPLVGVSMGLLVVGVGLKRLVGARD
jgi:hypothetical protein